MSRYTLPQYTALCEAIALGATSVKYSDKEVQYRSLSQMEKIRDSMEQDLGLNKEKSERRKVIEYNRGFE